MQKKQCGSCYWFETEGAANGGTCMYNPPQPLPLMAQSPIARAGQNVAQPSVVGLRPPTDAKHRCSKWSATGVEPIN